MSVRAYRDMGVAGRALGVGGGEDGVDEDEGADYLGAESDAVAVAVGDDVDAAAVAVVGVLHEGLDEADAGDGAQTLRHHVPQRPDQRHLPRQEQPERHRRVDVPPCNTTTTNTPPTMLSKVFIFFPPWEKKHQDTKKFFSRN